MSKNNRCWVAWSLGVGLLGNAWGADERPGKVAPVSIQPSAAEGRPIGPPAHEIGRFIDFLPPAAASQTPKPDGPPPVSDRVLTPEAAPAAPVEKATPAALAEKATPAAPVEKPAGLEFPQGETQEGARSGRLQLARSFRRTLNWGLAIPVYEEFLRDFPASPDYPVALLELARTFAQSGANEAALSRFYSLLDYVLKQDEAASKEALELSYTAQYEIAQIHLAQGRFAQAARLLKGMHTLPLADANRARVFFACARALKFSGDRPAAVEEYLALLKFVPESALEAETRGELIMLLTGLDRGDEALRELLALTDRASAPAPSADALPWRYWQGKAGNAVANMFYLAGRLEAAGQLYGKLAKISAEPQWLWPLLYQQGQVAERLKNFEQAKAFYNELAAATAKDVPKEIANLPAAGRARLDHVGWMVQMATDLQGLKN